LLTPRYVCQDSRGFLLALVGQNYVSHACHQGKSAQEMHPDRA
jgi:hypothetical protein